MIIKTYCADREGLKQEEKIKQYVLTRKLQEWIVTWIDEDGETSQAVGVKEPHTF